jgi:predicted glycosyltransferase
LVPIVDRLDADGHEILLTARAQAQTVELARRHWPDIQIVGTASPRGRAAKGFSIFRRAESLRRIARRERPAVAFSHGSYAQISAAFVARVPAVTMMDYEHQPANHLSFRLAKRVIVPDTFPESALRKFGAEGKTVRYSGFKEQLYLADFHPDPSVLAELGLGGRQVIAVLRPPPEGALYHRMANERFDEVLRLALSRENVQVVLLPRTVEQHDRYAALSARLRIPHRAIDGSSLLALADITIGAGGTMNRESALLGTPTYTVFAGELGAADAVLMERGLLRDLREGEGASIFQKKSSSGSRPMGDSAAIMETVIGTIRDVAKRGQGSRRQSHQRRHPS